MIRQSQPQGLILRFGKRKEIQAARSKGQRQQGNGGDPDTGKESQFPDCRYWTGGQGQETDQSCERSDRQGQCDASQGLASNLRST